MKRLTESGWRGLRAKLLDELTANAADCIDDPNARDDVSENAERCMAEPRSELWGSLRTMTVPHTLTQTGLPAVIELEQGWFEE